MTIGTNRIHQLTPADCLGRWDHGVNQIFGCTVYDLGGGAFTLRSVNVVMTSAVGAETTEVVHNGAAFQGAWVAGSAWNAGTGVLTMFRAAGYADGTMIKFTVCSRDGAGNDTYSSWTVGIGDLPGTADPPAVGDKIRVKGVPYRIDSLVGAVGSIRYSCTAMNRAIAGQQLLRRNDFEYISPRGRLDATVTVSE